MNRFRPALAAALTGLVLAVPGCGGSGRSARPQALPHNLGSKLATQSESVASRLDSGDVCSARRELAVLRHTTRAAISAGKVPPAMRGELSAAVDRLAGEASCSIPPEPATPTTTPTQPPKSAKHGPPGHAGKHGKPRKGGEGGE